MREKRRVGLTLRDVAVEARVSVKTVSRVLNNEPYVSAEKRDQVNRAVEKLGFRPNVQARRLKQNTDQSYLIGLLYDNPTASYISRLLVGTLDRCDEAGYRLAVECLPSERDDKTVRHSPSFLVRDDLDGVILTPPLSDELDLVTAFEARGQNMIRITPFLDRERTPYVLMDDFAAAAQVTDHLLQLGHRRIAHIAGHPSHGSAQARIEGFRTSMREAGIPETEIRMVQGDYTFAGGRACAEHLLAKSDRPTAIFAANDEMAVATVFAAQGFALKVPDDLSVAGFDDLPFASLIEPHLTTIRQPLQEMAEAAAGLLISLKENGRPLIDSESTTRSVIEIPYEFVARGSTAPLRG